MIRKIAWIGCKFFCSNFVYSNKKMMYSADDLIGGTEMNATEVGFVFERLMLAPKNDPRTQTIQQFAEQNGFMPMLVARTLAEHRHNDNSLNSLIATNEFLIKTFGKNRLSREAVEGDLMKMDKFWRHNDPLGVYQPGDMFYVDDNHPWRQVFPILILAPTAFVLILFLLAYVLQTFFIR